MIKPPVYETHPPGNEKRVVSSAQKVDSIYAQAEVHSKSVVGHIANEIIETPNIVLVEDLHDEVHTPKADANSPSLMNLEGFSASSNEVAPRIIPDLKDTLKILPLQTPPELTKTTRYNEIDMSPLKSPSKAFDEVLLDPTDPTPEVPHVVLIDDVYEQTMYTQPVSEAELPLTDILPPPELVSNDLPTFVDFVESFDDEPSENYEIPPSLLTAEVGTQTVFVEDFEVNDEKPKLLEALEVSDEISALQRINTQTIETTSFDSFIVTVPDRVEPPTIDELRHCAEEEQPVAYTLVRLVDTLLVEDQDLVSDEKTNDIKTTLDGIMVFLPENYQDLTNDANLEITPEITEKLLVLLEQLGYTQPKEALIKLAQDHSVPFIYQAMWYLCHINDKDSQQEFLAYNAQHDDTRLRLAKALAQLISTLRPQSNQTTITLA